MTTSTARKSSAARLINPAVLARIGNLDLVSRRVVDGFLSGLHQAVNLGSSTDFAEYRAYTPGDDIRRIDWRVFGRTDRLYIKTFEAETNADVVVALDCSASMGFKSDDVEKFDYARMLAASLVHLSAQQRDRVGYVAFTDEIVEQIPCAGRHRDRIIRSLDAREAKGPGHLHNALSAVGERLKRRGIVIVISDFYTDPTEAGLGLEELVGRGQDVIALHVLDPMERDLGESRARLLEDAETGERIPVAAGSVALYRELMQEHIDALSHRLGARRIDYRCISTNDPLDIALFAYLQGRARLMRTHR